MLQATFHILLRTSYDANSDQHLYKKHQISALKFIYLSIELLPPSSTVSNEKEIYISMFGKPFLFS